MEFRSKFELQQQFLEEARAAQSTSSSVNRMLTRRGNNSPSNVMLNAKTNTLISPHSSKHELGSSSSSANANSSNTINSTRNINTAEMAWWVSSSSSNNNNNNNDNDNSSSSNYLHSTNNISNSSSNSSSSSSRTNSLDSSTPFMPSTALPDDPTTLVREVPGAENIKALNEAAEHAEAVQRYMENENMSVEESAKYIMANGSTGQKISFFGHIRESLEVADQKLLSKIMSTLLECMWTQDPELQCQAPDDVLNLLILMNSTVAMQVLEVTKTMLTVETAAIRVAWNKLLLSLVACLTLEQIEKEIIPLAMSKSDHANPQDQRELSCDILGRVCEFLNRQKVEELVVPKAHTLCCDTNVGVRQRMCHQLVAIAHALGVDRAKETIAEDLFELLNDEERIVSRAAFSCLIDLVEFFGPEYRKQRLYPIIKVYIEKPPREMIGLLVGEFGRFLHEIKTDIDTPEDVELFASFYVAACKRSEEEARRQCAFYLPAVVASLPMHIFASHLVQCLNALANDKNIAVRRSIAAGLHELVPLLGESAAVHLETSFLTILRDEDLNVLSLLFKNIDPLLDCFVTQYEGHKRSNFFKSVSETLLRLHSRVETHWRSMRSILHVLHNYQAYISENMLLDHFIFIVLEYAVKGASVLRQECIQLVVDFMERCTSIQLRVQLLTRLNNDFAKSNSCYRRECYLRFVEAFSCIFSHRSVRERLLETALEIHRDPVTCVRLALARILPSLAASLQFRSNTTTSNNSTNNINNNNNNNNATSTNTSSANTPSSANAIRERFNNVVQCLLMDSEDDVRAFTRKSVERIESVERALSIDSRLREQLEQADYSRERQEQSMLEWAKEFDKVERRAKLRDLMKQEQNRDLTDGNTVSSLGMTLGNSTCSRNNNLMISAATTNVSSSNNNNNNNTSLNNSGSSGVGGSGNSNIMGNSTSNTINNSINVNTTRRTGSHSTNVNSTTTTTTTTTHASNTRRRSAGNANAANNNAFTSIGNFNSCGANVSANSVLLGLTSANSAGNVTHNVQNINSSNNNVANSHYSPSHRSNEMSAPSLSLSEGGASAGGSSYSNNTNSNSTSNTHHHGANTPKKQNSPMALPRLPANTQTRSPSSTAISSSGVTLRSHGLQSTSTQKTSKPRNTALRQHLHGVHSHLTTPLPTVSRKR